MVARRMSKKEAEGALKLTEKQQDKVLTEMFMTSAEKNERMMLRAPPKEMPGTRSSFEPNKKGQRLGGRQKGTPNKMPAIIIEAVVRTLQRYGYDGNGTEGLDGAIMMLLVRFPEKFVDLIKATIPRQVVKANFNFGELETSSPEEIVAHMKRQGLPVEQLRLFELVRGSALGGDRGMKEVNAPLRRREPIMIEHDEPEED